MHLKGGLVIQIITGLRWIISGIFCETFGTFTTFIYYFFGKITQFSKFLQIFIIESKNDSSFQISLTYISSVFYSALAHFYTIPS